MVPASIRHNLASLRRRERLLTLVWGVGCWLAIVLVLLAICGLVDWLIDRQRDTPYSVRLGMFVMQAAVAAVAALLFVLWPQIRRLPDALLALWIEEQVPQFEHRLITAVQLNQAGAQIEGMSLELVRVVTHEAEERARSVSFAGVADHARLMWTCLVLTPILALFALPFVLAPGVAFALLQRQALLDVDVPHSVSLVSASREYWPMNEPITIYMRVTGEYDPDMVGTLYVRPDGQSADSYPLMFDRADADGAVFTAEVNPSSVKLLYWARLADGRTRGPSALQVVRRPIVTEKTSTAWLRLPAYCGLRPEKRGLTQDDRRYEQEQARGDVVGIPGSSVRVQFEVANPEHKTWLVLLGPAKFDPQETHADAALKEKELRKVPMAIKPSAKIVEVTGSDGKKEDVFEEVDVAEAEFELAANLTGFRMVVQDEHGFENVPALRRTLKLVPEETPSIRLLRDTFSDFKASADSEGEVSAVPIGGRIRIPYECQGRFGLGSETRVYYRLLKKHESSDDPQEEEPWNRLTLREVEADPSAGPFDMTTGVFAKTPFNEQVQYFAIPARNPDKELGRTRGGGRYFLETKTLFVDKLGKGRLKPGDHIEYYVEVFAANHAGLRKANQLPVPSAKSESRVTQVMELGDFLAWENRITQERQKVKVLEKLQTGVFWPR